MRVCVTGMHRSGTSMVTRLLHESGVYLGEEADMMPAGPDNVDGYWENLRFLALNDRVLNLLGGAWDLPPLPPQDWSPVVAAARADAATAVRAMDKHEHWGWKDPRTSLTWPFWAQVMPGGRLVICLRNPLEVAFSLHRRHHCSYHLGLDLWVRYNQAILRSTEEGHRLITHYASFFDDPEAQLLRILDFLDIDVPRGRVEEVCKRARPEMRHSSFTSFDLVSFGAPKQLREMYQLMCAEARWLPESSRIPTPGESELVPGSRAATLRGASEPEPSVLGPGGAGEGLNLSVLEEHRFRLHSNSLTRTLEQARVDLATQQQALAEKERAIASLETRFAGVEGERRAMEQALHAHRRWLSERDATCQELARRLAEQTLAVQELCTGMEHNHRAMRTQEVVLLQKDELIRDLSARVESAEETACELRDRVDSLVLEPDQRAAAVPAAAPRMDEPAEHTMSNPPPRPRRIRAVPRRVGRLFNRKRRGSAPGSALRGPVVHLDDPVPDSIHVHQVNVRGWALSVSAPVERVEAQLGDAAPVALPLGAFRPDVAEAFDRPEDAWCGYDGFLTFSGLTPGEHELKVSAIDAQGGVSLTTCRLVVKPTEPPELPGSEVPPSSPVGTFSSPDADSPGPDVKPPGEQSKDAPAARDTTGERSTLPAGRVSRHGAYDVWVEKIAASAAAGQEAVARCYDEWAGSYDLDVQAVGHMNLALCAALLSRHVPALDARILDAGAGTGMLGAVLSAAGYSDLTALDISGGMLSMAGMHGVYRALHQGTLGEPLPFPDGAFSAVAAIGVFALGHAPAEALDELCRVTQAGGHVIFSVTSPAWERGGFASKVESLEAVGRWTRVAQSEPYRPLPSSEKATASARLYVYQLTSSPCPG